MPSANRESSIEALLKEAGAAEPRLRQILTEVAENLLEARLVVDREHWHRASDNDAFGMRFLSESLGEPSGSWDAEMILGAPALRSLRQVNARVHAWGVSAGAAKFRARVITAQGGEFCSMCGRDDKLAVDHIIPVSVGGPDDAVTNMQLLCTDCNIGKSALADRLLPTAVALGKTPAVAPRLRFKHLLLDSTIVDGRTRGVCTCGRRADTNELRVSVAVPYAAANLLTLKTTCADCPQET